MSSCDAKLKGGGLCGHIDNKYLLSYDSKQNQHVN